MLRLESVLVFLLFFHLKLYSELQLNFFIVGMTFEAQIRYKSQHILLSITCEK